MTRAHVVYQPGPPEVLRWEEIEIPPPGPGEARVRHSAVGLNYIDCYFRGGVYPPPRLPMIVGNEAVGVVEAIGPGVDSVSVGDRVANVTGGIGAYCEARNFAAEHLIPIPDTIDDRTAAAMMLKGMTAEYLIRRTCRVEPGDTVVFHAAAGGVGLIACQWLKHLGATVIGTVGTEAKADLARAHGCDHPVVYTRENLVERVREITGGKGVRVVYDSIGKDTFFASLDCLRPMGLLACFGQASGHVPAFTLRELAARQGLFVTRPSLDFHAADRGSRLDIARSLFDVVESGAVKIEINQTYALADAVQAHLDLEGRRTTGSSVFTV
jgi:NADPH2:quinone reductase